ncbi:DUF6777 domain-containing protein [Streptomyces sp. NPDC015127]|uniref:DUF6777 domain-containing protein n=1 Tax=Streptomyces sp. NPDC015127 TaxID=3364939 RepID=UPI003701FEFA
MRRLFAAVAVLSVGPLAAGCGGESRAEDSEEVLLQPSAAKGADPFTASTAYPTPAFEPPPVTPAPTSPSGGGTTLRTMLGSTPGLYGGTQEVASCDVEAQVRLLSGHDSKDEGKGKDRDRAFAEGAGIDRLEIPQFLRGLTPVLLRADTRITGHAFRDGEASAYQAVLQAGTAVLVDQYGAPRVRCAGGTPLKPPVPAKGAVVTKGEAWPGYRTDRVLVIKPATQVVNNLVIVNTADHTWIERPSGTDGEEDARPEVLPPVDPDEVFSDLTRTEPVDPADPGGSSGEGESGLPAGPDGTPSPQDPVPNAPVPDAPVPDAPVPDGPVPDGPVPDGPVPDGPVPDAPAPEDMAPEPQLPGDPADEAPGPLPEEPQDPAAPPPDDPPVPGAGPPLPVEPDPVPLSEEPAAPDPFQG